MPPERFMYETEPADHRGLRLEGDAVYLDTPCNDSSIETMHRQLGTLSVDTTEEVPIVRLTLGRHTLGEGEAVAYYLDMHARGMKDIRLRRPHGFRHSELEELQRLGAKATKHDRIHRTSITEMRLLGPPNEDLRKFDEREGREAA